VQIYFIRHAQSFNNALWDRTGKSIGRSDDPELSELGQEQAKALAKAIGGILAENNGQSGNSNHNEPHPAHFYTSLMVRAVTTGMEPARISGQRLQAWEKIHEGGGIFFEDPETGVRTGQPGKDRQFFERNFPELALPAEMAQGGWWNRPHETIEECEVRAKNVIEELMSRHGGTDDRVVLISHGGFYNVFLRVLFQMPCEVNIWFALNNCGITRIDFEEREARLIYANRIDFMPKNLIS
jgi:2,3-bisphosphoglycerate-dependent phosphoglycerate mutase